MKPSGDVTKIQNTGTSGTKIGHMNVSDKENLKKNNKKTTFNSYDS